MTPIRVSAVVVLVLIGLFYVLRVVATACSGAACDVYIPLSLLLPILILVAVVITGVVAIAHARRGPGAWLAILGACTVLGALGPIAALLLLKDSPDLLVPLATVLWLLVPVSALVYSFSHASR